MKFNKSLFIEYKHFLIVLLLIPLLIWFKYLEMTLSPRYYIHAALDEYIPFLKIFVIPYLAWFPYVAFGYVYTGLRNKINFYKLNIFLAGGMSAAYIIYMIFPNAQHLRPVITQNDFLSDLTKFIYLTDTPTNVCPSVHVINAVAIDAALRHSREFGIKKYRKTVSLFLIILICLSTVFIKQHSVVDVFWGLIVSAGFYIQLYVVPVLKIYIRSHRSYCDYKHERGEGCEIHDFY